ncbi:MAG: PDZ domain-containing protein [Acidobacteria bacterium]|nr:MAG: PDZ domain-containing protein [Acidobacteriota bacterium]
MTKRVRLVVILVSSLLIFYVIIGGVLGRGSTDQGEKSYRDLGVYSQVLSRIQQEYVTQPNLKNVTKGAIRGLLEALDPYSTYFTPVEYKEYMQHPDPGPASVGIYLSKRMGFATVVSVFPGSPAEKAGISPGDLIDEVNGERIREFSVVQITRLLDGVSGTSVSLSVIKGTQGQPQKLTLNREILNNAPLVTNTIDSNTAYVRVPTFDQGKSDAIAAQLKHLISSGDSKIILDLRDCAGGTEGEGEKTANLFLDHGLITYLYGQRYPRKEVVAQASDQITKLPLVVLINQSTAGPAEIVAGAVLDNKRGDVVGVTSFGVGVYQKLIPVGDGSALLLSVAKYYTPDGKPIPGNGITPNVMQSAESEAAAAAGETAPPKYGGPDDKQLQKALEILNGKAAPVKSARLKATRPVAPKAISQLAWA